MSQPGKAAGSDVGRGQNLPDPNVEVEYLGIFAQMILSPVSSATSRLAVRLSSFSAAQPGCSPSSCEIVAAAVEDESRDLLLTDGLMLMPSARSQANTNNPDTRIPVGWGGEMTHDRCSALSPRGGASSEKERQLKDSEGSVRDAKVDAKNGAN